MLAACDRATGVGQEPHFRSEQPYLLGQGIPVQEPRSAATSSCTRRPRLIDAKRAFSCSVTRRQHSQGAFLKWRLPAGMLPDYRTVITLQSARLTTL
jgi:hypothetical protein